MNAQEGSPENLRLEQLKKTVRAHKDGYAERCPVCGGLDYPGLTHNLLFRLGHGSYPFDDPQDSIASEWGSGSTP
jgi:hypothetical protein